MIVIYQDYSIDGENWLFSDAEILEDVAENFVGGDFADDGADVVEGFADVLGEEVGREGIGDAFPCADEGVAGVGKGLEVAGVRDECGTGVSHQVVPGLGKG